MEKVEEMDIEKKDPEKSKKQNPLAFETVDALANHISSKLLKCSMDMVHNSKQKFTKKLRLFKLDQQNLIQPKIVYLNIGGKCYTTTVITLTKRFPNSYLSKMLNG
jgi:hypothetical protein